MVNLVRVSLILSFAFMITSALSGSVEMEDKLISRLRTQLPATWQITVVADTLKIEHPGEMWVLDGNYINAPAEAYENSEANKEKIQKNGRKTKAHFFFLLKDKKKLEKSEFARANYFSQRYALFQVSAAGFDTPYARYYPFLLEEETTRIYNVTLRENLKMGVGPVYPEVNFSKP